MGYERIYAGASFDDGEKPVNARARHRHNHEHDRRHSQGAGNMSLTGGVCELR